MLFVRKADDMETALVGIDKATAAWTMQAARGECAWICADCSCTFPEGMPDECLHGHEKCTSIIKRDKTRATENKIVDEANNGNTI